MNLNDLPALLKKFEDHDSRYAALQEHVIEMGQAMSDVVALLEKQGPLLADAIAKGMAEAMKGLKFPEAKAPAINVSVPPFDIPAPVVQVMERDPGKGWRFDTQYNADGSIKSLTAHRL